MLLFVVSLLCRWMREANGECVLFVVVVVADGGVILFKGVVAFGIGIVGCVKRVMNAKESKGVCEFNEYVRREWKMQTWKKSL